MRNWLPRVVARVPVTVHAKMLAAFVAMVIMLIAVGAAGLQVLAGANRRAEELVRLQRKIAAYRQLRHITGQPFSSFFSSLRKRQSVPWAMIFCGLDLIRPASLRRSA